MRSANGKLTISGLREVLADITKITKVQPKEEELGGWKQLAEAWRIHDGWLGMGALGRTPADAWDNTLPLPLCQPCQLLS